MLRLTTPLFALLCGAASTLSVAGNQPVPGQAKDQNSVSYRAWADRDAAPAKPAVLFKNAAGQVRYIVDLEEIQAKRLPERATLREDLVQWQRDNTAELVENMKRSHAVAPVATTSLVGSSFTAYLSEAQVAALRADPRVKRITADFEIEPSAVWVNQTSGGQTTPWGVQAVGGPAYSSGAIKVYVIDSGVAYHGDLPNVVERISVAGAGMNPIGCYGHATHVAGIIGAANNSTGVVGVDSGVPIVSMAVGTNAPGQPCSNGSSASAFVAGLEEVKARILNTGTVGIVNISYNGPTIFNVGQTLGDKMLNVATPAPGYPGAFIAQSAGNQYANACTYAYNSPNAADGIMVVGAIDYNGQPVVPLNQIGGFRNMPYASNETGSNYGGCVEAWAPGNAVYSTWNGPDYVNLSGTSMAAPHVAGFAAYLAEALGLTNSVDIELAVRARMQGINGSSAALPNLNLQAFTAQPTAEFAESGVVLGSFVRFHDEPITTFRYDSIGASYCNLVAYVNGGFWYSAPSLPTAYQWPPSSLTPAQYQWNLDCVSPYSTHGYASATAQIKRQVTLVQWTTNTWSTGYTWQDTPSGSGVRWTLTGTFAHKYTSQNADYCQLRSYGYLYGPYYWRTLLWDSGPNFPTSLEFVPLQLGDPNTAAPPLGPYHGYYWELRCWNADGGERYADMYGTVQP